MMMKRMRQALAFMAILTITACANNGNKNKEDRQVKVKTEQVSLSGEANGQTYAGTVEAGYSSSLSFAAPGTVSQVLVDEGMQVKKGQILATIDPTTAKNTLDLTAASLRQAEDAYNRLNDLYKKGSLPEIQHVEAQTRLAQARANEANARKLLSDCVLRAPFAGYIASRSVDVGSSASPAMPAFELVRIDPIEVKISVPEAEIAHIKIGQKADFKVTALNGRKYTAQVKTKGVQAGAMSRTYNVHLSLSNTDHALLPGMICDVVMASPSAAKAIVLPQQSIMLNERGAHYVWIVVNDKAVRRDVQIGEPNAKGVTVTSGLSNGDEVIVEGQNKVSQGVKIIKQ